MTAAYWIVDLRDRVAQRVTDDAADPGGPRFWKVCAEGAREAIDKASRLAGGST